MPKRGPASVLLGNYLDATSPVNAPFNASYLWIELKAGEEFIYTPPDSHNLAWVYVQHGQLKYGDRHLQSELAVFEDGHQDLHMHALTDCSFLWGSAARHPHELVLGYYSVHTSEKSLAKGKAHIAKLGEAMKRAPR